MVLRNVTTSQMSSFAAAQMKSLPADAIWNHLEHVLFILHVFLERDVMISSSTALTTVTSLFSTIWIVGVVILRCIDSI